MRTAQQIHFDRKANSSAALMRSVRANLSFNLAARKPNLTNYSDSWGQWLWRYEQPIFQSKRHLRPATITQSDQLMPYHGRIVGMTFRRASAAISQYKASPIEPSPPRVRAPGMRWTPPRARVGKCRAGETNFPAPRKRPETELRHTHPDEIVQGERPMSALMSFIFESYCLSCQAMFPELASASQSAVE